ncbi:CHY zinc finger protein [Bacillus sp. AK031]
MLSKKAANVKGHVVKGVEVDPQTRCRHYHSDRDIIAIKFKCCNTYYPCHLCHQETAGHPAEVWEKEQRSEKAVLCGACGNELSINEYMMCHSQCPNCSAAFNPGCELHYDLYFKV